MQVVGRRCGHCAEKIVTAPDAVGCHSCDSVFHFRCIDHADTCPECRQDFSAPRPVSASTRQLRAERRNRQRRNITAAVGLVSALALCMLWLVFPHWFQRSHELSAEARAHSRETTNRRRGKRPFAERSSELSMRQVPSLLHVRTSSRRVGSTIHKTRGNQPHRIRS